MTTALSTYQACWGAAGLAFALGGARALARAAERTGVRPGPALRAAPALAVVLAFAGARLHAMLSSPAAVWASLADGSLWAAAASGGQRVGGGLVLAAAFLVLLVPRASAGRLSGARILDALAPAAGFSIALGRLGCLAAGCCFGTPARVPWAWSHPTGSAAYWNHVAQGLLPDAGTPSLPVHPLPVYLGTAAALAALVGLAVRRRASGPGTVAAAFVLVLAGTRLAIEPWRETRFMGGVPAQRELGLAVVALAAIWLWRARGRAAGAGQPSVPANAGGPSSPGTPRRWMRRAVSPSPSS